MKTAQSEYSTKTSTPSSRGDGAAGTTDRTETAGVGGEKDQNGT